MNRHLMGVGVVAAIAAGAGGLSYAHPGRYAVHHDIAYYVRHPDERTDLLRKCRSDHVFDHMADCKNATTAETSAWGDTLWKESERRSLGAFPKIWGHR